MTGPTAQRHLDAIRSGRVDKSNIIGIRKAINHVERLRRGFRGHRSNVTRLEVNDIERTLNSHWPIVVGELHETGLKLLCSSRYKRRLEPYAHIIANITQFRLVRFNRIGKFGMYVLPVYCADSPEGSLFFQNIPWQSGGNGPEILGTQ